MFKGNVKIRVSPVQLSYFHIHVVENLCFFYLIFFHFGANLQTSHHLSFPRSDHKGTSRLISQRLHLSDSEKEDPSHPLALHDPLDVPRLEHQQRADVLEEQQQMKILEWESRMKVLAWEQDLMREKVKAARQKGRAFRMKKVYYKAKLKKLGEDVPPSSASSDDEEEHKPDLTG